MKTVTVETAARLFEPMGSCRNVEGIEKLNRINEGTYKAVYRAQDRTTRQLVELKGVLLRNEASTVLRSSVSLSFWSDSVIVA
ncbi:hypothetical protein BBJ28_00026921 [Nothophytophthora sp. Chile5]|nr:hypothetical protein BBJ28_00026921 [Nothophytophthora sp. Chile5]